MFANSPKPRQYGFVSDRAGVRLRRPSANRRRGTVCLDAERKRRALVPGPDQRPPRNSNIAVNS